MQDPRGLVDQLLIAVEAGPLRLGRLVAATGLPAVARTHLLHLLWHRRLATDLAHPLSDQTWVHPVGGRP
ncbi:hypothetical protein VR46_34240 [Streptomyces sp. NRRL S-444]|nr:hypothetical protein VR46_34240 [Streptomyces sp. NRRL S-444]